MTKTKKEESYLSNKESNILQIKITIDEITPKIWRRFQVENDITLHQLHEIIQIVMGWDNYHLYSFTIDKKEYQDDKMDDWIESEAEGILSSRKQRIDILKPKQKFNYVYDFGDCWEHTLVVEKILPKDTSAHYPWSLEGERNCPPEDCGSTYGYHHLLEIRKNKKHPEYKSLIEDWLGDDYNPDYFNTQENNIYLRHRFPKKGEEKPDGRARYWILKK